MSDVRSYSESLLREVIKKKTGMNLYPLFFSPNPAIYPIVYSFNSVQIVNKIVYTMNISE